MGTIFSTICLKKYIFRQGGIRTPDTVVRSHILYPTELLVLGLSVAHYAEDI